MLSRELAAVLEPEADKINAHPEICATVSIAISLKRIADAMANPDHAALHNAICTAIWEGMGRK